MPRMGQPRRRAKTQTLSESRKEMEAHKEELRTQGAKRKRPLNAQISLRFVRTKETAGQRMQRFGNMLSDIRRETAVDAVSARMRRKRTYNKAGSMSRRGATDDDFLLTARADLLCLDSGSRPFGNGYFDEGKKGEPGKFVADTSMEGVCPEPVDWGPYIPGDSFVTQGKMGTPGRDVHKPGNLLPSEKDKDVSDNLAGFPRTNRFEYTSRTFHPSGCRCRRCREG